MRVVFTVSVGHKHCRTGYKIQGDLSITHHRTVIRKLYKYWTGMEARMAKDNLSLHILQSLNSLVHHEQKQKQRRGGLELGLGS